MLSPKEFFIEIANLAGTFEQLRFTVEENLMGQVQNLTEAVNNSVNLIQESFNRGNQAPAARAPIPVENIIGRPAGIITNHHIRGLLRDQVPDLEEKHNEYVYTINRVALNVCRELALAREEEAQKRWRDITEVQRTTMADESLIIILENHPEIYFMQNCVQLWPIIGLIQSKWTQMSSRHRRK